jgi:hypothetical protein
VVLGLGKFVRVPSFKLCDTDMCVH